VQGGCSILTHLDAIAPDHADRDAQQQVLKVVARELTVICEGNGAFELRVVIVHSVRVVAHNVLHRCAQVQQP
jgi:hypothetical protein